MKKISFILALALAAVAAPAHADPISAIAAIGSMVASGGVAAIATGGLAALGSLGLAGGLAFAGGALGLVGSVTGNKKLKQLGGVLGLAGGFAGLAKGLGQTAAETVGGAVGETVGAGAEALAQTAATPAQEVAAGLTESAGSDAVSQAISSSDKAAIFGPTGYGGEAAAAAGPAAAQGGGILSKVGGFIKDNKELVNLGGGLISGAMKAQGDRSLLDERARLEEEQRQRYNASITGLRPQGQFIRPGQDVTSGRAPQDPIRYVPRRPGLIRNAQGG